MKRTLVLCSIAAVTLALWPATPHSQTRAAVPAAVANRVAAGQPVSVIVGVATPFAPEGALAGAAAIDGQRAAVVRASADTMTRASAAGVVVGEALDVLPFFTARVDQASLDALAALPGVRSIELNVAEPVSLASSTGVVNAPPAWAAGATGAGWKVAVIDTGVDKAHPFLGGRVSDEACYTNAGGTGIGTSTCPGGGYASTATGSGVPCTATVDCRHGTHVAGIAAGANGAGGINGVAPGAGLVAINAFTRFDGIDDCLPAAPPCARAYVSDQVLALQRVAALAGVGNTGRIASVNMSLGAGQYADQATCDANNVSRKAAIDNLRSLGVPVVIAAGNAGLGTAMNAPGCISSAISVGSVTDALQFSSFTNNALFLTLLAPGSDVVSSVPGGGYLSYNGTSMATPHVAGAWAVLRQAAPTATIDQVMNALRNSGTLIEDQRGLGGNPHMLMNVDGARRMLTTPLNGAPGNILAIGPQITDNSVSLNWSAPVGGGVATAYTLYARTTLYGPLVATLPLDPSRAVAFPAPNGRYYLSIVPSNAAGVGPESYTFIVNVPTPPAPPGAPTAHAASVAGNTATFTWNSPTTGGPVYQYYLVAGLTPGFTTPLLTTPLPFFPRAQSFAGIPAGTYYTRVIATNTGGTSPASNEVAITIAPPGAPVLNAATVTARTVTLSWSAGPGGAPSSYTLYASVAPGGPPVASLPLTGNTVSIPNVPPGTYYLRMTASSAIGTSGLSNQITVVVP